MKRVAAVLLALAPVAAFGLGAWTQDVRMRDHYIRQGQIAATYDAIFDGQWLYLGCLSDDCKHELADSDFIVRRGEQRLKNGGAFVRLDPTKGNKQ